MSSAPRVEELVMPAANLGPENPLPSLVVPQPANKPDVLPDNPDPDLAYVGWGCDTPLLPYRLQDGYDRERRPRAFQAIVLENEHLRATFLPELGGRLWSLVARATERELLFRNPVFQPADLAARNAWFSGGVEWNCSIAHHTPLTCEPLFAALVEAPDGRQIVRLYEWDRIRGALYQLDAWLPADSPVLFVGVRYINPHDHEVPAYWWSNIAVPETAQTRVLVPADEAYSHAYSGGMDVHAIHDRTYPAREPHATDYFYRLPAGAQPWVAALEADGQGLFQTSTPRLKGRKLFVWGQGPGGQRWQEFLSVAGQAYIEIQAGLARTQGACLPMPARATWHWVEAYGLLQADPAVIHGDDWVAARTLAAENVAAVINPEQLAAAEARFVAGWDQVPTEHVNLGRGWGRLEIQRRARADEPALAPPGLPFPVESLTDQQQPWLDLLSAGRLPARDPRSRPGAWLVQKPWRELLRAAVADDANDHWLAWLHLGVMAYAVGDEAGAREAWRTSSARAANPVATRCLAQLDLRAGDKEAALAGLVEACRQAPDWPRLAVETGRALLAEGRAETFTDLWATVWTETVREQGRMKLLAARAALALGNLDQCEALLHGLVVPDMREGEVSLTDLWYQLWEQRVAQREGLEVDDALRARVRREYPPPADLDFRMHVPADEAAS